MEEPEVPTEHLHEHMEHEAHGGPPWVMGVALSSAIIAALAAVASLLAGGNANEAMVDQMKASDQWSYYQAKGVKSNVLASKMELLAALGKEPDGKDREKLATYKKEQDAIKAKAEEKQESSEKHLNTHETMAKSVTMFQMAIAISAIAVLSKKRKFWYLSIVFALVGIVFFSQGLLMAREGRSAENGAHESGAADAPMSEQKPH